MPGFAHIGRLQQLYFHHSVAIGLTASLAWTIEAIALLCVMQDDVATAAQLAGYARGVHPSIATRAGSRKAVAERLAALLQTSLAPADLTLAFQEGARWNSRQAAETALSVLQRA